jgi:hypothetical protein
MRLYDRAYGNINYGHTSGLTPYYKMLNLLFWYTLCPSGGDSNNISHRARNLLYQMAPGQPKFNVCHFGMRSSFVHTLLLVDVTMHCTFS